MKVRERRNEWLKNQVREMRRVNRLGLDLDLDLDLGLDVNMNMRKWFLSWVLGLGD
jgi:hypothetical protein